MSILALVLAGGRVDELLCLTEQRPKSALPVFATYRIIDFVLSNLMHAGIRNVGVLSQYRPYALVRHLGTGEHWDFVGRGRGIRLLPPYRGLKASDWYKGTADAVYQNTSYIDTFKPQHVLIASADHIYRMDYRPFINFHLQTAADITISFTRMKNRSSRFGYGVIDRQGRLQEYQERPDMPPSDLVSMTLYLFKTELLIDLLEANAKEQSHEFGRDIISRNTSKHRVFGYKHLGYWAYARTVDSYYNTNMDVISGKVALKDWQIRTNLMERCGQADRPPAYINGKTSNSVISEGCVIEGTVINSLLSPGITVAPGALVTDSIIFHDAKIGQDSRLEKVICDKDTSVGRGCIIGGSGKDVASVEFGDLLCSGITILGKNTNIPDNTTVGANSAIYSSARFSSAHVDPGSTLR
jgi:glucose-1-phosphate adenylyltransferase